MALDIFLWKANTGKKSLSSLGTKIWSEINPNTKIVKRTVSVMHALKKNILFDLQALLNTNNNHIVLIDIIINFLIATL